MSEVAVIAGHGPGFCEELAFKLAESGYAVGLIARSEEYLEKFAEEMREAGYEAHAVPLDLTDEQAVSDGFCRIREELGSIGVVAHTASFHEKSPGELDPGWAKKNWELYTHSILLCFRQVVDDLRENEGTFVCFGAVPEFGDLAYKTAKAGTRGIAQALADKFQSEGIQVSHVIVAGSILNPDKYDRMDEIKKQEHMDPEAVAETTLHLIQQPPRCRTFELDIHTYERSYIP